MTDDETVGKWCWHVHHNILVEILTEPFGKRVDFIRNNKYHSEIPLRLSLMHICRDQATHSTAFHTLRIALRTIDAAADDAAFTAYDAAVDALHARECPECPWDGHTIFPGCAA